MLYQVRSLDVWGNEEEGFTVNDNFDTGMRIDIDEKDDDDVIILKLINVGFIQGMIEARVDGEIGGNMYVELNDNSFPICELRVD
jgi:hypothetical protein